MQNKVASPVALEKVLEYVIANSSLMVSENNSDTTTDAELHVKLQKGYKSAIAGRTQNAAEAFKKAGEKRME